MRYFQSPYHTPQLQLINYTNQLKPCNVIKLIPLSRPACALTTQDETYCYVLSLLYRPHIPVWKEAPILAGPPTGGWGFSFGRTKIDWMGAAIII